MMVQVPSSAAVTFSWGGVWDYDNAYLPRCLIEGILIGERGAQVVRGLQEDARPSERLTCRI